MNGFVRRHQAEMEQIARECRTFLLEQIMPFWTERVTDPQHGGYWTCFDSEGKRYDDRKSGWFLGRVLYMYSVLCQEFGPRPEWLEVAKAGYDFLPKAYVGDGRFANMLSADGQQLEGACSIFTDHFIIKGLMNYLYTLGDQAPADAVQKTKELLDRLLEHVQDPEILRMECPDERFQKHAVNFMTLAVLTESTKLFGDTYSFRLRENVYRSLYHFASDQLQAPMEYIAPDGKALPVGPGRLIDAGHTMESLWFAMEAAPILHVPEWNARAEQVLDWVIRHCWDETYGGFYQHVDYERGTPEEPYLVTDYEGTNVGWDEKIWWVQAEGLIALCMSAVVNQNEEHWQRFVQLYQYVRKYFIHPQTGEWYSFLHRDGSLLSDLPGSMHKGPYHVPRCLMMLHRTLHEALQA